MMLYTLYLQMLWSNQQLKFLKEPALQNLGYIAVLSFVYICLYINLEA